MTRDQFGTTSIACPFPDFEAGAVVEPLGIQSGVDAPPFPCAAIVLFVARCRYPPRSVASPVKTADMRAWFRQTNLRRTRRPGKAAHGKPVRRRVAWRISAAPPCHSPGEAAHGAVRPIIPRLAPQHRPGGDWALDTPDRLARLRPAGGSRWRHGASSAQAPSGRSDAPSLATSSRPSPGGRTAGSRSG